MGIFTDVLLSKPADIESNSKEGIEWFKEALQKMSRSKLKNINLLREETETDNVRDDIMDTCICLYMMHCIKTFYRITIDFL